MGRFFATSRTFHHELTSLYDFVNPTAVAIWNLRWQVQGYLGVHPEAEKAEIDGRFVSGSGIRAANLRKRYMDSDWDQQASELASFALYGAISLYEGWLASFSDLSQRQKKQLQHPTDPASASRGATALLRQLQTKQSDIVEAVYAPSLRADRRYAPARLDDLLKIYRCFKEIRNAFAHAGGVAGRRAEEAYFTASPVTAGLGMRGASVQLPHVTTGAKIEFGLNHFKAIAAVLYRILITIDAELAITSFGTKHLLDTWRLAHPSLVQLPADPIRRSGKLEFLNNRAGLPPPTQLDDLYSFLRSERLVV
jgi:hypothetical protein